MFKNQHLFRYNSGATFSLSQDNAILDASGSYIPLVSNVDGTAYIDVDRLTQIALMIIFAVMIALGFWYYLYKKII